MTELVLRRDEGDVTRITLNDAATRNSLSLSMIEALRSMLSGASAKVIIIAAQPPVFCSGHNLKEITAHRQDDDSGAAFYDKLFNACSDLMLDILHHPAAIIAEVDGMASAAGCQLVATCDLAVASKQARFCTPGVNIGLFCSTPMVALSRTVSRKHALEMLLTGEPMDAEEAFRMGLINRVTTAETLHAVTNQLAQQISRKSPEAIRVGKKAFHTQTGLPEREAYAAMARVMLHNLQHGEAREGISAFLEKREPRWTKD